MPDAEDTRPLDSSFLFNADAQAVLEEAPSLDSGLEALSQIYSSKKWDDEKAAADTAAKYAEDLRHRFKDNGHYSNEEIGQIAPIRFGEVSGEGDDEVEKQIDHVNKWEAANKEVLLNSPYTGHVISRDKLIPSIESTASELRRLARVEGRGTLSNAIQDTFFRILDGGTSAPAKLLGLDAYVKGVKERTDPSYDDDFSSDVAAALGTVGGATASSLLGPAGLYGYLGATGGVAVRDRYETSLETSGDKSKALQAAGIEVGSQAIQLGVGGKLLTRPAKILGKTFFGKEAATVGERALLSKAEKAGQVVIGTGEQALAGGASGALSTIAGEVGSDSPLNKDEIIKGAEHGAVLGAVFGAAAKGLDVALDPKIKPDPTIERGGKPLPEEKTVVGAPVDPIKTEALRSSEAELNAANGSFVTKDGSIYTLSPEGNTYRAKPATNEEFSPLDRTFFVEKPVAERLAALREVKTPDGKTPQIFTDGEKLLIKSEYIDENLAPTQTPTGGVAVEIPVQDTPLQGSHPVEVNKPRTTETGLEYRNHIGREITAVTAVPETKSAGAMGLTELPERKTAQRLRLSGVTDAFGDSELGLSRYFPQPNVVTKRLANEVIAEKGVDKAIEDYLSLPDDHADPTSTALAYTLIRNTTDAAQAAKSAGDIPSFNKLSQIRDRIGDKLAQLNLNTGQAIQANVAGLEIVPEMRIASLKQNLVDAAHAELAAEEGLTPEDIRQTGKLIAHQDELIKAVNDEAKVVEENTLQVFDKDIEDSNNIITEIEKAGEERFKEKTQAAQKEIEELNTRAKEIEDEATAKVNEETATVKSQLESAKNRVKELETKGKEKSSRANEVQKREEDLLKKLEEGGKKRAEVTLDKEITVAEKTVEKLKAQGKDTTKVAEGLEKLKEKKSKIKPEDGLNTEEKAELRRLRRLSLKITEKVRPEDVLSASEKKELDSLKKAIPQAEEKLLQAKKLPEKTKLKLDALKKFVKDKEAKLSTITKEDQFTKKEKKDLESLKIRKDEAAKKKAEAAKKSYLSEAQKQRLAELKKTRDKLSARKDKIEKKVREKVSKITPKDEEQLTKLYQAKKATKAGTTDRGIVEEKIKELEAKVASEGEVPGQSNGLFSYFLSNIFSGIGTQVANLKGNTLQLGANPLSYVLSGRPDVAIQFLKGALTGVREGALDAVGAFLRGESRLREGEKYKGTSDFVKTGIKPFNNLGYVLRGLRAADAFFFHTAKEGQARAIAYYEGKKAGKEGDALRTYTSDQLSNSSASWKLALKEADSQAAVLKELGINRTPNQIKNTAWEIMESKRPDLLRQESNRFAYGETFNNTPKGYIGYITKGIGLISNAPINIAGVEVRPGKYLLPVVNVGGNILNSYLDYTPVGLFRALNNKEIVVGNNFKKELRVKHNLQKLNEAGKFMLGTTLTGTVYGIARSFLEDKDPYFQINGPGPTNNPGLKAQMRQEGWRPYTIKIGDKYWNYLDTPLSLPMGAFGAVLDNIKYNKSQGRASTSDRISMAVLGSAGSFVNNSFLKNVSTLLDALTDPEKSKNLGDILGNTARGFIPGAGALKSLSTYIDDPIETKGDMWSKFVSGIPFAESYGTRPALNAFGEPIGRSFEERMFGLSRFYNSRTTDPTFTWLAESGYTIPDATGPSMTLPLKENKAAIKRREQNLGPEFAGHLTNDERYELIEKAGPKVRATVEKFKARYGNSAYQEKVQESLNDAVSKVWSDEKRKMFLK